MGLNQIRIPRKKFKAGTFNIQAVNNYHQRLKDLIFGKFKGVVAKYLNNYLVYHNFINFSKSSKDNKELILLELIHKTICYRWLADVAKRPAIAV